MVTDVSVASKVKMGKSLEIIYPNVQTQKKEEKPALYPIGSAPRVPQLTSCTKPSPIELEGLHKPSPPMALALLLAHHADITENLGFCNLRRQVLFV